MAVYRLFLCSWSQLCTLPRDQNGLAEETGEELDRKLLPVHAFPLLLPSTPNHCPQAFLLPLPCYDSLQE